MKPGGGQPHLPGNWRRWTGLTGEADTVSSCAGAVQVGHWEGFFREGDAKLGTDCCGTECYGLVDKTVIGERLDLIILEVFPT